MKVAVFVEYFPPKLGSDRRIFEIMKRLSRRHEIHFIVFPPFRMLLAKNQKDEKTLRLHFGNKATVVKHEGIDGHFTSLSPGTARFWQKSLILAYVLTCFSVFIDSLRTLQKIDPDIIVLNYPSPYTGLLGFLEGKFLRKTIVLDFNDLIAQYSINLLNFDEKGLLAKTFIFIQNYIAKSVQLAVVPTSYIKNYAKTLGISEKRLVKISNGVDTEEFSPHKYDIAKTKNMLGVNSKHLCVYCGRLDGWAGTKIITRLCEAAKTRDITAKFALAGSGAMKVDSKSNVIFLGEIKYEKVPALLAIADAILIPFPKNEVSHAASPLKLFEGMAMQKPVIASKVAGVEEVVTDGENGFLADSDSIEGWLEKIGVILDSEEKAKQVGENARRTVLEKFDWEYLARQYEEALNRQTAQFK
jgi:glycosyltransferase involved in cell wall biosynthesis